MKRNPLSLAILMASAVTLVACNGDDGQDGVDGTSAYTHEVSFKEIAPAITDSEKNSLRTTDEATVAGEDQTLEYRTILATGETDNGETYGLVKDYQDNAIKFEDDSDYICNGTGGGAGSGLDHFSILQKNNKLYMVSQFECGPAAMYMNELEQSEAGELSLKEGTLQFVSQKDEFGGWVHCAGMTTPWNSHLGSEEYEPNAKSPSGYYDEVTLRYWGGDANLNNPYYYGWTPEVQVNTDGTPNYIKHYSMGRFAHELAYVMPDNKTVYLSDDGGNVGLFMFVADTAEDLSAGTLYAAKWNQTSGEGLGEAVISWIDLGHTTNAAVRAVVAEKIAFTDVFDFETPNEDGSCPTEGFTAIYTANGNECLQLQDINGDETIDSTDEVLASRLETRRFAAMMGATTEFNKEEGITFNARDNKLYVAMSKVSGGMEENSLSGVNDDITVEYNKCGGVYALAVANNESIGSDYVAYNMKGLVAGTPVSYSGTSLEGNSCDVESLASPDNVTFLAGTDVLVIGEDTSYHPNDMVWAYDVTKKTLTRIATTPYGAESTSPFWHKDVNGFGYLTLTTQHPFGEVSGGYVTPEGVDTRSTAGYIGPFDFSNLK